MPSGQNCHLTIIIREVNECLEAKMSPRRHYSLGSIIRQQRVITPMNAFYEKYNLKYLCLEPFLKISHELSVFTMKHFVKI